MKSVRREREERDQTDGSFVFIKRRSVACAYPIYLFIYYLLSDSFATSSSSSSSSSASSVVPMP